MLEFKLLEFKLLEIQIMFHLRTPRISLQVPMCQALWVLSMSLSNCQKVTMMKPFLREQLCVQSQAVVPSSPRTELRQRPFEISAPVVKLLEVCLVRRRSCLVLRIAD